MARELTGAPASTSRGSPARAERIALVDLLDRLLAGGVVITGDVTISIAQVDLVHISLRAVIASIRPEMARLAEYETGPVTVRRGGRGGPAVADRVEGRVVGEVVGEQPDESFDDAEGTGP